MTALTTKCQVSNSMCDISNCRWGGGGEGEGGIGDMRTDASKNPAYRPEPNRKCMLNFKGGVGQVLM